jgi:glycosyltransferase involved in cell wall biosynthesis
MNGPVPRDSAAPPRVSVIMATFNRPQYLGPAIGSVLRQTMPDLELIIADDGSDDATRAVLRSLTTDPRVRVLWREHCGIPAAVRNAALREARGQFVAFQDSDDVWMPDKLARQLAALVAREGARWSYTACAHIDASGAAVTPPGVSGWREHRGSIRDAVACLRAHSALPTVLAERALLGGAGYFDESLPLFEDHDLWLRLACFSEVAVVPEALVKVRRHENHYSGRDELAAAECRTIFLERAWRCDLSPAARAELRRLRALQGGRVARLRAQAGKGPAARDSLRASLSVGWRYPRWWIDAAHTLLACPPSRELY